MKSFIFGLLTLCLWASFARYYYVCKIKDHCSIKATETEQEIKRPETLFLALGDSIVLEGFEQFYFSPGETAPTLTGDNKKFINQLAFHVREAPDATLKITGFYRPGEKGIRQGFYEDIGLARAGAIRDLVVEKKIEEKRVTINSEMYDSETLLEPIEFDLNPNYAKQ